MTSESLALPRSPRSWILLVAAATLAGGCQPANQIKSTGTVRFDGRPVETGSIVFRPVDSGGTVAGALIRSGSFSIVGAPGRQRVEIRGTRPVADASLPRTMPRIAGMPVHEDFVPAAYNAASTLEIEVTPDGPNFFEFDLRPAASRP